jgi:glycosyltransferase involved in cell wall biosynthesis
MTTQAIAGRLAASIPYWMSPYARRIYRYARAWKFFPAHIIPEEIRTSMPEDSMLALLHAAETPDAIGIGSAAKGSEIVMLVVSDLRIDPRVEREALALTQAGFKVTIYCPDPTQGKDPSLKIIWGENIDVRFLHWSAASFVMACPGFHAGQLFQSAVQHRPFAFHAHDLSTAFAARAAARITGAHLVVDFHEWFSENVSWNAIEKKYAPYEAEWKKPMQELERLCLREASAVVTVCDSIADAMAEELGGGRRPQVVRNIPQLAAQPSKEYPPLKKQLSLANNQFVVLYQGGTGPTRLLEPIIEALGLATRCTLVIRGPSIEYFEKDYRKIAHKVGAGNRLILLPPVPSKDVVAAARGADVGIWSLPKLSRNFYFALPNKIFEYLAAGLPVAGANFPEVKHIVETYNIGVTFNPYDAQSIASALIRLEDETFRAACARNTRIALSELNAESEWQKLVNIYERLPRVR